ncbi:hypothetical protein SZ64_09795 [Erythrobacter sp. SG61-1L]|uniref:NAD(P)/FAD-dependent oxidoreductase n=1 Tax=Erythrobacter sp. SG61-1L TaxID=1603897 RepID=UPI0006D69AA0|nr:FAD-dependent oxidoreductase [Erythrobacter sp. SG61-1L]KPL68386.1 hypothetical protein SZ64_09795 [Erythrobacter sp. SG61-1L]
MTPDSFDFLVIGAGIGGLSAAAELSRHGRVMLIEKESAPCYHSSGRSAAMFARHYGSAAIRALTDASEALLNKAARHGFYEALAPEARGILFVAPAGYDGPADANEGQVRITAAQVAELVPLLPAEKVDHGLWDAASCDMDVHAMHLGLARILRSHGGEIRTGAELTQASRGADGWHVVAGGKSLRAAAIVNAAGGWADEVATLCGAAPLGIEPRRRSAVLIDPPESAAAIRPVQAWPMVFDMDQTVYFKPEGGKLMLSPMDATPVTPHDCWAEELDIAIAVDRFERLTGLAVQRVSHSWAGLRSFLPDNEPAIGPDPVIPAFYWLAGQGGSGIKIAAAAAALLAAHATESPLPDGLGAELARFLSPARLTAKAAD